MEEQNKNTTFISLITNAIHSKKKINLTFYSQEDKTQIERICAPMDIGPSRRAKNKQDRFHFWDYSSDKTPHALSLIPSQIIEINILDEAFNPADFVRWDPAKSPWFIARNWGVLS